MTYVNLFNQSSYSVDEFKTNQIYVADGSATSPSIAFILDPSTGIFREASGTLSITSSGIEAMRINNGLINVYTTLKGIDVALSGTLTAVNIDGTTMIITGNITVGGLIEIADGSANNPSLTFSSDNTTGLFKYSALSLGVASNGISVCKFNFSAIQMFVPLSLGTNLLGCGAIAASGLISCTNDIVIGNTSLINTGLNRLQLYGSDQNTSGPHLQAFTSLDNYPLFQQLNWTHDNISLNFDCYWDGSSFRSSHSGSNFRLYKSGGTLQLDYSSGNAQGSSFSTNVGYSLNSSGQSSFGTNPITAVGAITSSGNFSNGTHTLTSGAITSSGTFSNGANSMTTGSLSSANIGINTAPDATMALKAQITGTNATGLELASFGTGVAQKIQFFDDNGFIGPYINFNSSNNGKICANGNLLLCAAGTTSQVAINSINVIIDQELLVNANIDASTNSLFCGAITSSGTISNGTNSLSCGSEVIGSTSFINTGYNKLQLYGPDQNGTGPHLQAFTSIDNYPVFQNLNWTHNNTSLNFDMYFDGNFRSSLSTSNFNIWKVSDQLQFNYCSGTTAGNILSLKKCGYFDINGSWNLPAQACRQRSASTYMSVSNAVVTTFNTWDTDLINQGGITTDNTKFTVLVAGFYCVQAELQFDTSATGVRGLWIIRNGSDATRYGQVMIAASPTDNTRTLCTAFLQLSASDYVSCNCYQTSGASLHIGSINGVARFTVTKLL